MSYNSSTGIITAPVSIKDVCDALNIAYNSNYADVGFLCTRTGRINPTARFKPFKGGGTGVETNLWPGIGTSMGAGWADGNELDIDGNGRLSNRAKAAFGTNVPLLTWDSNGFPNNGTRWIVNVPSGGLSEPYRLTDFNGYISVQSNCWSYTIENPPHFALRNSASTSAERKFQILFKSFKDDGSGGKNKYYVSLADVALTSLSNLDNLYLWTAIIVESSNSRTGMKCMYAKRLSQSFGAFRSSSYPIFPIEFDTISDFTPIIGENNGQAIFDTTSDISGNQCGLYNVRGPFKLQFFIGPYANEKGIVSNIYNVTYNNVNFNRIYGLPALEPDAYEHNCLSLACNAIGDDVSTINYAVVSWSTNLTQIWCNSSKVEKTPSELVTLVSKVSGNGKTVFTISNDLKFLFNRANISGADYVDITSTTVYYKIVVSYLITAGISFTIDSSTTTHTNSSSGDPYSETTTSGSFNVPLGGSSAPSGVPPQTTGFPSKVTVNTENYSALILKIELKRSGSSSGTFTTVLEDLITLIY